MIYVSKNNPRRSGFLQVGCPVRRVLKFGARRTLCGGGLESSGAVCRVRLQLEAYGIPLSEVRAWIAKTSRFVRVTVRREVSSIPEHRHCTLEITKLPDANRCDNATPRFPNPVVLVILN